MQKLVAEFEIKDLLGIGMTLVVLVIGLAYGLQVTGEARDDIGENNCAKRTDGYTNYLETTHKCSNATIGAAHSQSNRSVDSSEWNSTGSGITALSKIPQKLPTIVTVIIAAVIIGILLRYLYGQFAR